MRNYNEVEPAVESLLRVRRLMPKDGDLSVIVLKGHLLIEELLGCLVCMHVKCPQAIEAANLSFYSLASVAKALYFEDQAKEFWDAVFQLNTLRNSLAHNIEPRDLSERLRRFALAASGGNAAAAEQLLENPQSGMIAAMETMCGFFIGMTKSAGRG